MNSSPRAPAQFIRLLVGVFLIGLLGYWLAGGAEPRPPRLIAAAAPEGYALVWSDPRSDAPKDAFFLIQRKRRGPWSKPRSFRGPYRAAAKRGDEALVFFGPQDGYSVYRDGERVRSEKWPFDWTPQAAAVFQERVWTFGEQEGRLRAAVLENGRWRAAGAVADAPGRTLSLGAAGLAGALQVWRFAEPAEGRTRTLTLYERKARRWEPTWSSELDAAVTKAAAARVGGDLWVATARRTRWGRVLITTARRGAGQDQPAAAWRVNNAEDFAMAGAGRRPVLAVIGQGVVRMTTLEPRPAPRWEICFRPANALDFLRGLGTLNTALTLALLALVVVLMFSRRGPMFAARPAEGLTPAPLLRRGAAIVTDYLIGGFLAGGAAMAVYGDVSPEDLSALTLMMAVVQAYRLVGLAGQEYLFGRTVGKRLMGLRVVLIDGRPLRFSNAFIRNLFRLVDEDLFFVGVMAIVWSPWAQRLGDMIAHTMVVDARGSAPPADA